MTRAIAASSNKLKTFKFVVGGAVSATRRDAVKEAAVSARTTSLTIWSGVDLKNISV